MNDATKEEQLPKRVPNSNTRRAARSRSQTPAPRNPPRPPPISIAELRSAIANIVDKNPAVKNPNPSRAEHVADRTLQRMARQTNALQRNLAITASDFPSEPSLPCSNSSQCNALLDAVAQNPGLSTFPPKRGFMGRSRCISWECSGTYILPASGTGGFTEGDDILVITPIQSPHKGSILFCMSSSGPVVLSYIYPNRDIETLGTEVILRSFATDAVTASMLGGTSVQVSSQVSVQSGLSFNALGGRSGQMSAVSYDGRTTTESLSGQVVRNLVLADLFPEDVITAHSDCDEPNTDLVDVGSATTNAFSSAVVDAPKRFILSLSMGITSERALAAGWTPTVTAWVPGVYDIPQGTEVTLWDSNLNAHWRKHILFGDFKFELWIPWWGGVGPTFRVYVTLDTGAGATTEVVYYFENNFGGLYPGDSKILIDTRGSSIYAPYRGGVIRRIRLTGITPGGGAGPSSMDCANGSITLGCSTPSGSITFYSVPNDALYSYMRFSGMIEKFSLNISQQGVSEVVVDPTALHAAMLNPVMELPISSFFTDYLKIMLARSFQGRSATASFFSASSLRTTLGHILRVGGKVGKIAGRALKNDDLVTMGRASGRLARSLNSSHFDEDTNSDELNAANFGEFSASAFYPSARRVSNVNGYSWRAGSFGRVPRQFHPTQSYPAVVTTTGASSSEQETVYALVPVQTSVQQPSRFARAFPASSLGSPSQEIQGASGTLAMLLDKLDEQGFPTRRGLFVTGEAANIRKTSATSYAFDLLPVDDGAQKRAASVDLGIPLYGLFPEGWWNGAFRAEPDLLDLFPPSVMTTLTRLPASETEPYGGYTVRISAPPTSFTRYD